MPILQDISPTPVTLAERETPEATNEGEVEPSLNNKQHNDGRMEGRSVGNRIKEDIDRWEADNDDEEEDVDGMLFVGQSFTTSTTDDTVLSDVIADNKEREVRKGGNQDQRGMSTHAQELGQEVTASRLSRPIDEANDTGDMGHDDGTQPESVLQDIPDPDPTSTDRLIDRRDSKPSAPSTPTKPSFNPTEADWSTPSTRIPISSSTVPSTPVLVSVPADQLSQGTPGAPKYSIASRRPKGWISSLTHPRVISDLSPKGKININPPRANSTSSVPLPTQELDDHPGEERDLTVALSGQDAKSDLQQQALLGRRRSGQGGDHGARARVTSVHAQPPSGRRVSGAMQYAIAPEPRQDLPTPSGLDLSNSHSNNHSHPSADNDVDAAHDVPIPDHKESFSVHENPETGVDADDLPTASMTAEEEAQIRYDVSAAQDEDEVWMSYVRAQLGALFPDFFDADPAALESNTAGPFMLRRPRSDYAQEYIGDLSGSPRFRDVDDGDLRPEQARDRARNTQEDVFSTPGNTSFTTTTTTTTDDGSSLATPPQHLSAAAMLRGNVVVPNVREEISGLREEIMRLRQVVGGLAQGMGVGASTGGNDAAGTGSQVDRFIHDQEPSHATVNDDGENDSGEDETSSRGRATSWHSQDTNASEELGEKEGPNSHDKVDRAAEIVTKIDKGNQEPTDWENLPDLFKETANTTMQIIRALDSLNKAKANEVEQGYASAAKKDDGDTQRDRTDNEMFSRTNLENILQFIQSSKLVH